MRRKLVAGNWKMNLTATEAAATVETFIDTAHIRPEVQVVICPSYLSLGKVRELIRNSDIQLGAQDVFWKESGAFTGQVSSRMLSAAGCTYCIVGHSETRGRFGKLEVPQETVCFFGDNDHTVNLKVAALLAAGIHPILCVGESDSERGANMTDAVITTQLARALEGHDPVELDELVVAYEPVWAIGTGNVCEADEAERVCSMIRDTVSDLFNEDLAQSVRVLYGGSVKSANAKELFGKPNIDGGLVGGASLDPREFAAIVAAA